MLVRMAIDAMIERDADEVIYIAELPQTPCRYLTVRTGGP
jgi:hypothetical protein